MKLKIWILSAPVFASVMSTVMLSMVFSDLGKVFGRSLGELQERNVLFFALFAGLLPFFGKLSDRRSPLLQLRVGLGLFIFANLLSYSAVIMASWSAFIIGQGLMAIADAVMVPAVIRMIGITFEEDELGWAFGSFSACISAATLAGPALTGLVSAFVDWRMIFLVLASISLAALILSYVILAAPKTIRSAVPLSRGLLGSLLLAALLYTFNQSWLLIGLAGVAFALNESLAADESKLFPAGMWSNRGFLFAATAVFVLFIASNATCQFTPTWLRESRGFTTNQVSWILMVDSVVIILLGPFAGRFIDRSLNRGLLFGVGCSALAMAILPLAPLQAPAFYFLVYALLGLAGAFIGPALNTLAMAKAPRDQVGAYMGVFQFLQFSSGAISASVLAQMLSQSQGSITDGGHSIFGAAVVAYLVMFAIFSLRSVVRVRA